MLKSFQVTKWFTSLCCASMIGWKKSAEPVSLDSLRDTAVFDGMLSASKPKWMIGVFWSFHLAK